MICSICSKLNKNPKGLEQHIRYTHKISSKEYYLTHINRFAGHCFCGKQTTFKSLGKGFCIFCSRDCMLEKRDISGSHNHRWNSNREEQETKTKTKKMCFGLLHRILRARNIEKQGPTYELLGYTPKELRQHLESLFQPGMTWKNHGQGIGKWNIDHIRPVSSFPIGTSVAQINSLKNLRPLWESENLSKGAKWVPNNVSL